MIGSVINDIIERVPKPGSTISFMRLDGSRSLDLTELHEMAGRLAGRLRDLGVGPGDRIGILAANGLEWVLLDLAALRLKAVTAGFEPGKFEPGTALIDRYDLTVLFTDRPCEGEGIRPIADVVRLAEEPADPPPPVRYAPDEPTTIKFTSGSTGEPKGLAATAGSIDASISAVQEMFGHGPDDDLFIFLPLSLLQQRYWIYSALRYGHDVTVCTYEVALPALSRARPTVVMGVPGFYEAAKKHIEQRAARNGSGEDAIREAARRLFGDRVRTCGPAPPPRVPRC